MTNYSVLYSFLHLIIIFFFVFIIFYFNKPCLDENQNLEKKFYLFLSIFVFEFSVGVIVSRVRGCVVPVDKITRISVTIALFALTGLSIWQDFKNSDTFHIDDMNSPLRKSIIVSLFIVLFIAFAYFLNTLFFDIAPPFTSCLHDIYSFNIPFLVDQSKIKKEICIDVSV